MRKGAEALDTALQLEISTLTGSSSEPKVTAFEQEQRRLVKEKLGTVKADVCTGLKFLLSHGEIEDEVLRNQGFFQGAVKLKELGLVRDRIESGDGQRFWFVNHQFKSALQYLLFEGKQPED